MATSIEISEQAGVRYLHFGSRWVQGAMRIGRPYALELEYTRDMMLPLLLREPRRWPRSVLLIGLGAASLTKFLHRHRPDAMLTVVEIASEVVAAATTYFRLPVDPARLTIEIGDGCDYVAASRRRFDLVLVDGYDAKGRTGMLDTLPFYCNAYARLSDRGVLAVNLLSRSRGVSASLERARQAFADRAVALPQCASGNAVVLGAAGEPITTTIEELRVAARALKAATGLNLLPTIARVAAAQTGERFEL
jgi:spermidine synthase